LILPQALEKYNVDKDNAAFIKNGFDTKYNPTLHATVGQNFGSYVTHEKIISSTSTLAGLPSCFSNLVTTGPTLRPLRSTSKMRGPARAAAADERLEDITVSKKPKEDRIQPQAKWEGSDHFQRGRSESLQQRDG